MDNNQLFVEYYKEWVSIYKEGAIRPITLSKYLLIYNRVVDKMKVVYPFYESVIIKKPKKVNV